MKENKCNFSMKLKRKLTLFISVFSDVSKFIYFVRSTKGYPNNKIEGSGPTVDIKLQSYS
jgi:hypothetical protein